MIKIPCVLIAASIRRPSYLHVSLISPCLPHISMSPSYLHVSLISPCFPHISMSPSYLHVSLISPCFPHISMSPSYLHVSLISPCLPHISMSPINCLTASPPHRFTASLLRDIIPLYMSTTHGVQDAMRLSIRLMIYAVFMSI